MKNTKLYTIFLVLIFNILLINTSRSQVLISLLLGDVLNRGGMEFGLTGGDNMSWISGQDDGRMLNTFNIGFYFDIRLKEPWYLYTGVLVKANMGTTSLNNYPVGNPEIDTLMKEAQVERKLKYFNVPLMIKYRTKIGFFAMGGFQLGLLHRGTDIFTEKIIDKEDLSYSYDITKDLNRIDAGLSAGLGYKFQKGLGVNIGARYYYGLVNIYKDTKNKGVNSSVYFFADIPIGAKKAKEKTGELE
ncbi:MAG: PorT family protein [Bacteroidetes bacterium]|nr:PorT family protein [Bacteroidota bacterium]